MTALLATARRHLREPLFLHAYALGLSGLLTSGFGVVYWAIAARLYPADVVGVNSALLSLVMLLGNVSQLNLRSGFGRFVPVAGERVAWLIRGGYLASLALATVTSTVVVLALAFVPGLLPGIPLTPMLAILFPVTAILWTLFTVQDQILTALRRTTWVPFENAFYSVAKIVLLVAFVGGVGRYGILVSWSAPTIAGVAIVSGWIFARLVPDRMRAVRAGTFAGRAEPLTAGVVARYVAVDYVGNVLALGTTALLPIIVLAQLGSASSAHFYIVTLVASATQLVPTVLATSLLVEASADEATFEHDGRRVLRQLGLILVPGIALLVFAAQPILSIFGGDYAGEGSEALRLYALAGIPYALLQLAYIRQRLDRRVGPILAAQAVLGLVIVPGSLLVLPVMGITGVGLVVLVAHVAVASVVVPRELRPLFRRAASVDPVTPAL